MLIRSDQKIVHDGDGKSADDNGRAACHAAFKNMLRIIDLLDSDNGYRIAAKRGRVGPITIRKAYRIGTNSEPRGERDEEESSSLCEYADDDSRRGNSQDGRNKPKDCFL